MMLGPAERLVKHSSTAGLDDGRMVSVSTASKFATHPNMVSRSRPESGMTSDGSITDTGASDSAVRSEWEKEMARTHGLANAFSVQSVSVSQWSCRESNPGPTACPQGFSVRSPLCLYSDLPVTRTSRDDDPSRCWCPDAPRDRTHRLIPLADARVRAEGVPGLTD